MMKLENTNNDKQYTLVPRILYVERIDIFKQYCIFGMKWLQL